MCANYKETRSFNCFASLSSCEHSQPSSSKSLSTTISILLVLFHGFHPPLPTFSHRLSLNPPTFHLQQACINPPPLFSIRPPKSCTTTTNQTLSLSLCRGLKLFQLYFLILCLCTTSSFSRSHSLSLPAWNYHLSFSQGFPH